MRFSNLVLILILILAIFLRFYRIGELYSFIGDQGWFYLSAKDLLAGHIPLVGITASYTWLHQGALWTYILAPVLLIFNFNPIGGAYMSALVGVLGVLLVYFITKKMFSQEVGLIAALILAVSPLDIIFSRMPYHTTPIVICILLFIYFIYKYSLGREKYLPLAAFMLGVLYNFEIATMILWFLFIIIFFKVRRFNFGVIILSILSFLVPMIPMILYDFQVNTGFYQITAFPRLIKLSIFNHSGFNLVVYSNVLRDLLNSNQKLIFSINKTLSAFIILYSLIFLVWQIFDKKTKGKNSHLILAIWIFLSLGGIMVSKTASGAYLPMLYPGIIILVSYFIFKIGEMNISVKFLAYSFLIFFALSNIYLVLSTNYFTKNTNSITSSERIKIAKEVVALSESRKYNLISKDFNSEFPNSLRNYEYLAYWLGNQPSQDEEKTKIIIDEENRNVYLMHE